MSQKTDIEVLVEQLKAAERANLDAKGDDEIRHLLNRTAHMLIECRSVMESSANALESAIGMRAGYMDNVSRHDEVMNAKNRTMRTTADFLRSLVKQSTPSPPVIKPKYEVL